jgi:hypothetical protein
LLDRGDIGPKFGRAERFVGLVERDQAMLLRTYPDRFDLLAAVTDFFEAFCHRRLRRINPSRRVLFNVACGQSFNRAISGLGERENFALIDVEHEGLGALGAAIDSETKH